MVTQHPSQFQIIVTDIEMPEMNGFDFAQACREQPVLSHIPFIAYTSKASEAVSKKCSEAGISECIMKTDRSGLLHAISHCLALPNGGLAA